MENQKESKKSQTSYEKILKLKKEYAITKQPSLLEEILTLIEEENKCENFFVEAIRIFALRKLEKFDEGFKIGKQCLNCLKNQKIKKSLENKFKKEYAWLIYSFLKNQKPNYKTFSSGFEKICTYSQFDEFLVFSAFIMIFYKFKNHQKVRQLDFLFYDSLIQKYKSFSELEKKANIWKAAIKFFKEKQRWDKVNEFCVLFKKENDFDFFVERDYAISLFKLGKEEQALKIYNEKLLIEKKDWYLFSDLGVFYYEKGDLTKAKEFALKALLLVREEKNSVKLLSILADIFEKQSEREQSAKHYALLTKIRQKNNWKIDEKTLEKVSEIDLDSVNFKEFKKIWKDLSIKDGIVKVGEIIKILPNGRNGFLKTENKSLFFISTFKRNLQLKDKVLYFVVPSYDRKKKKYGTAAFVIEVKK